MHYLYAPHQSEPRTIDGGANMKIETYFDEFFNNCYNRDLRVIGKQRNVRHAPKVKSSNEKHAKSKRNFIRNNINSTMARYNNFYGWHTYFEDILDYQVANEDARIVNHFFFDFDKEFANGSKFKRITKGNEENKGIEDLKQLPLREYRSGMNAIQEQIQDMIVYENILKDSWNESKKVYEYFKSQGLTTYTCLSMSKGVHLRCFFKPIHVNNYNRIIHNLHDNLVKQFNLKTLDEKVTGKDSNPLKSVERLPYTYNEKSGLRVTPFSFETDSLSDVINKSISISKKRKLTNVEPFNLSEHVNTDFHNGILKLDSQIDVLVKQEQEAKNKLLQEKIKNGTINGNYAGGNGLFKDLRILVRFVCGDENLVSEHALYDKYKCVFHQDKSPSAIVGKKNYTCLSSNCKVSKLNYFEFIRTWFGLKSDSEVKEKMVELQKLYDEKIAGGIEIGGENVEQEIDA